MYFQFISIFGLLCMVSNLNHTIFKEKLNGFLEFQSNETVQSLRLNGNKIGNKGGMYFAQMLQINVTLEALDLGDTDLVSTSNIIAWY